MNKVRVIFNRKGESNHQKMDFKVINSQKLPKSLVAKNVNKAKLSSYVKRNYVNAKKLPIIQKLHKQ
jgi:hypothetical protein